MKHLTGLSRCGTSSRMSESTDTKKCTDCRFCLLEDYGYSNWTVEGTMVLCLKRAHPDHEGFDHWFVERALMPEFLFIRRKGDGPYYTEVHSGDDLLAATRRYVGRCTIGAIGEGIDFEVHELPLRPARIFHAQYDGSPSHQSTKKVLTEILTEEREVDRW